MTVEDSSPANGRAMKEGNVVMNLADKAEETLGGKGFLYAADTSVNAAATGQCFFAIHVLTEAVFTTMTPTTTAPITGTITGVTLPAGTDLFGKFTVLTLASGSIIAYKGALI
jgi:hypothetical protein